MENFRNESDSVALRELETSLNRHMVVNSTIGHEVIDGVHTETRTVRITPALAEMLLLRNKLNRPVTKTHVRNLATAMENGEWNFDGTPITFDKYGNLINGQHRLTAVVKSGKTIVFKVGTGFSPQIFATMDIGKVRTGSDVLGIAGYDNPKLTALGSEFIFKFLRESIGKVQSSHSSNGCIGLSKPELLKFAKEKPYIHTSVDYYVSIKKKAPITILSSNVVIGLHYLFSEKNSAESEDFFLKLLTGADLDFESPIFHLRNRLVNSKNDRTKRLNNSEIVKLIVLAWNKIRNKEKVRRLSIPTALPKIM